MSKAFLPEDSAAPEEPLLPPRSGPPRPITPEGHRRLREERASLDPGNEAHRSRIAALDRILATVEVRPPARFDGGAGFGCQVRVRDARGTERVYTLVGPDEIDASAGHISTESPLGQQLLGRRAGETIEIERAGRTDELEIVSVA